MDVVLRGSSPSAVTAGIMLLTRARQLGFPLKVSIVGDPGQLTPVTGAAVMYAPVLASCGVGREMGSGATVVLPGPPGSPLLVTISPHGVDGWFMLARAGDGAHPATQAFSRLVRDGRPAARRLARGIMEVMEALGVAPEHAVLDLVFGAPCPPLLRLALALRAGRAMAGGRGDSVTRWLSGGGDLERDPSEQPLAPHNLVERVEAGELTWVLDRLTPAARAKAELWVHDALALAREDAGRDLSLVVAVAELASHLAVLPVASILPPLGAAEDSVAVALGTALRAVGEADASQQLTQVYRFLGGRFVSEAADALVVSITPEPSGDDPIAAWQWFSAEARVGRKQADALWDRLFPRTEA